jgi:hypothetical protein
LAQRLNQELRSLVQDLRSLAYNDAQFITALDRTYRLIAERIRQELNITRDPMQPDKPIRAACATVFGCEPKALRQLEYDDDQGIPVQTYFASEALARFDGIRKQLTLVQMKYPQAQAHNVFQFVNDFDLLFSASDAAELWSEFAVPAQMAYWEPDRRLLDWRRIRKFGLP